ncbi:MAG: YdiU family protein [Pseudomonadota bacterium]
MNAPEAPAAFFPFDNSFARLPERFFAKLPPTPVPEPHLIRLNDALSAELGLDAGRLRSPDGVAVLAGNTVPGGADPLAMAYAGHQFGNWVPQLGDGRAILLGEVVDRNGDRRDIQLKGSGRTPFSRMGDGRAWIGPVLREYVVSEAMAALGVPTTRALAAVSTGETILREAPLPGAVLTRVARSHVRVGTFQYFAARRDEEALKLLADHVIDRLYPDCAATENPIRCFLDRVVACQAQLVARWMAIGFIHGVMNTDNMSVAGETIDYGPCAFMDSYHPATVFSSIDAGGRYAYQNQPYIAHWNLTCLAQALLPLLDADREKAIAEGQAAVDAFPDAYGTAFLGALRGKLGLKEARDDDAALAQDLLTTMAENEADFTLTFRGLCSIAEAGQAPGTETAEPVRSLFKDPTALDAWLARWHARLGAEGGDADARAAAMRQVNPAFIPRNHRVEEVIAAAVTESDFGPFERLMTVLSTPYDDQPESAAYADPPEPEEVVQQTFCGT